MGDFTMNSPALSSARVRAEPKAGCAIRFISCLFKRKFSSSNFFRILSLCFFHQESTYILFENKSRRFLEQRGHGAPAPPPTTFVDAHVRFQGFQPSRRFSFPSAVQGSFLF